MPVAFEEKIRTLSRDLGSQAKLAEVLDVNRSQLTRWLHGSQTDDATALRVDVLEMVLSALLRVSAAGGDELDVWGEPLSW